MLDISRIDSLRSWRHALPFIWVLALIVFGGACGSTVGSGVVLPEKRPATDSTATAAAKEVHTNKVRWKTASELDNFGFDVYRSESPDGPFARINTEIIEGAGTSDEVHAYEFVDDMIDPHKPYYYYVESISMSGERERFTPIANAPAKLPGH